MAPSQGRFRGWNWGDALPLLERLQPDARIVNLETSITRSDDHWPGKGIHYRMHPDNVASLTGACIDLCVLANNHVLDFGYAGLSETLSTLHRAGIATAGAGADLQAARRTAILDLGPRGRIVVAAVGTPSSGHPKRLGRIEPTAGREPARRPVRRGRRGACGERHSQPAA